MEDMEKIIEYPNPLPKIERGVKGLIVNGVAQDTNKNGTAGRPCKYCENKEEYQANAEAFLDKCKKGSDGKIVMPWIEELALELNTIDENIVNWANKMTPDGEREHPEFFTVYSMVKMLQKLRLQQRAIGRYNPAGPLSLLKFNHGMMETSKQVLAGDKNAGPIQIEFIEEKPRIDND